MNTTLEFKPDDLITKDGQTVGYIFDFTGHGAFAPNGKVENLADKARIDAHNRALSAMELEGAKQNGKALWYYVTRDGKDFIADWAGQYSFPVSYQHSSWHNMAGKDGRTDFYFTGPDGKNWHGVNIGDSQIVRCHRLKRQ